MANNSFGAIQAFFQDFGRARQMYGTYQRLSGLSDAELSRRGLSRDTLIHEAARRCGLIGKDI